jgi:hypothetical protein
MVMTVKTMTVMMIIMMALLVKRRTRVQKVVSSNHIRPNIKLAHSTGRLTVSTNLVVIS